MSTLPITMESPLEERALTFPQRARAISIADQKGYEAAAELLLAIKELRAEGETHHRPMIDAAHKSHKAAIDGLKRVDGPLAEAEGIIKPKISVYLTQQENARLEAERIMRAAQEQAAAEALESSIEAAEADGASREEVSAMIMQPAPVPVVRAAPTVQAVSGISAAKTYHAEVVSIRELAKAVAEGKAPESWIMANLPMLNGMARSTRGALRVPGVRIIEDTNIRAGRR